MIRRIVILSLAVMLFGCQPQDRQATSGEAIGISASKLRCEYRVNPLGIDDVNPRLSWIMESTQRNQQQVAYRVIVASSMSSLAKDFGDLWDSRKIASDETTAIEYAGRPLTSGTECYWKVKIWGKNGTVSNWSAPAKWTMGLLSTDDWKGQWIGYDTWEKPKTPIQWLDKQLELPPAKYLRKPFTLSKPIDKAYLYSTSMGLHQMYLNGYMVADEYFNPGWTDYFNRIYYRTYDVTEMLKRGPNTIGAILADGWFSGYVGYTRKRNHYGTKLRLLAQLHVEYADGTTEIIASDPTWKASLGPVRQADFLIGETYDARLEIAGWGSPDYNDSDWAGVDMGTDANPQVKAAVAEPVVAFDEVKPVGITEPKPGQYIFDMGQNFAGVIRIKMRGKSGQKIQLRHAEWLNPDGTMYITNLRFAKATDTYYCKGQGTEIWQPRFTFHGFQYVEVTGLDYKPRLDDIIGLALSSDLPVAGQFECSDPVVNKISKNAEWTMRMNFIDVPTDCPQRDERLGWTGDAQVYVNTACYQNDVQAFFIKWLHDLDEAQREDGQFPKFAPLVGNKAAAGGPDGGPAWADAGIICPWTIYKMYGDKRVLGQHYDGMKKFIEFTENRCTEDLLPPEKFHCFGDWLNINDNTPNDVIFMAYFGYSTNLMAQTAEVLGQTQDAAKYTELFERIKTSFQKAYVAPDGKIKGDTQSAYVMAIAYDLLDEKMQTQAADHLIRKIEQYNWHLSTGFVGTKDLMLALAKIDRNDVAYQLLHNETFPSWGFSVKHGATTIWERWNGWTPEKGFNDPGMNSFAHYSFGAVCQWMFENIGGIQTDGAGFKHIIIKPQPGGKLTWANTNYDSIHGQIKTGWSIQDDTFNCHVLVPANTTATLYLPADTQGGAKVYESEKAINKVKEIEILETKSDVVVMKLGSGLYSFKSKMP